MKDTPNFRYAAVMIAFVRDKDKLLELANRFPDQTYKNYNLLVNESDSESEVSLWDLAFEFPTHATPRVLIAQMFKNLQEIPLEQILGSIRSFDERTWLKCINALLLPSLEPYTFNFDAVDSLYHLRIWQYLANSKEVCTRIWQHMQNSEHFMLSLARYNSHENFYNILSHASDEQNPFKIAVANKNLEFVLLMLKTFARTSDGQMETRELRAANIANLIGDAAAKMITSKADRQAMQTVRDYLRQIYPIRSSWSYLPPRCSKFAQTILQRIDAAPIATQHTRAVREHTLPNGHTWF